MKIFISSTFKDLERHRKSVIETIDRLRHTGTSVQWFGMEAFSAADQTPLNECLSFVDQSDMYLGFFGVRYGSNPPNSEMSFTEAEYRRAVERDIPRIIFLIDQDNANVKPVDFESDPNKLVKLQKLKEELQKLRNVDFFTSPDDLAAKVLIALNPYLKQVKPDTSAPFGNAEHQELQIQYYDYLRNSLDRVDATRIAASLDRILDRVPLSEVYVPLHGLLTIPELDVAEPARALAKVQSMGHRSRHSRQLSFFDQSFSTMDLQVAIAVYPGLVILGEPGSGKTSFLKYVAVSYAMQKQRADPETDKLRVPIFLTIAAYAEAVRGQDHQVALEDYFAQYYRDVHGLRLDLRRYFEHVLQKGSAIVLLDGLDEVKDEKERIRIGEQIERFWLHRRRAGNQLVVTSRIVGYNRLKGDMLGHITLNDFDSKDIRTFLSLWCPIIERAAETDPNTAQVKAVREQRELEAAIFGGRREVRELAAKPLLLTLLALLKRRGVKLPEQRVELYEEYVQALVEKWYSLRNPDGIITHSRRYGETERVLASLALWIRETSPEYGIVDEPALKEWLTRKYKSSKVTSDQAQTAAAVFIDDLRQSGLIIARGYREFGFIHPTFEEYLAAKGLCYLSDTDLTEFLKKVRKFKMLIRDSWRETLMLAVGHLCVIQRAPGRAGQFVEFILQETLRDKRRGLNTVRAGEILKDVGASNLPDKTSEKVIPALYMTMIDSSVLPKTRRDAGLLLGALGWEPADDEDISSIIKIPANLPVSDQSSFKHLVNYDFWIGRFPVTNSQFRKFVNSGGYGSNKSDRPKWWSKAAWRWQWTRRRTIKSELYLPFLKRWSDPLLPITLVSWYEAVAYCGWLSERWREEGKINTSQHVRLPTEAEWIKAARGPSGKAPIPNEDVTKIYNTRESRLRAATPVMMYRDGVVVWSTEDNSKVYDLFGNVVEWLSTRPRGRNRVYSMHGLSYHSPYSTHTLSFSAQGSMPFKAFSNVGFRIVVVDEE